MELRHLRYFLALAERLNFTQAAAQVHVTQSTLSHQISQLEEDVYKRQSWYSWSWGSSRMGSSCGVFTLWKEIRARRG